MDILQVIATALSALAAVLAWAAKLWWSKEYASAKDETIKAKEAVIESKNAQIEMLEKELANLRDFTPMKLKEYFISVKSQLEGYNDNLKQEIEEYKQEILTKDDQIGDLTSRGAKSAEEKNKIQKERDELAKKVIYLEEQTRTLMPIISEIISTSGSVVRITKLYPEVQRVFSYPIDSEEVNELSRQGQLMFEQTKKHFANDIKLKSPDQ